jgi:hypothetical protein
MMMYQLFEKGRSNLSKKYMKVDSSQGNWYLFRSGKNVNSYPTWMLDTCSLDENTKKMKFVDTIP